MTADLKAMAKDVAQHRDEIIERMVNFSLTDTLLFRNPDAEDLIAEERQVWDPIVEWAKKNMDADFKTSESLEVPMENNASLPRLQVFLEKLSDKELAAFYQTGKITKSVCWPRRWSKSRLRPMRLFALLFWKKSGRPTNGDMMPKQIRDGKSSGRN